MSGVCRLGDRAKAPIDVHGCPACPHQDVIGPSISASSNVYVNGAPALRVDDIGMHAVCCGTNMWKVMGASAQVFVNGSAMVRKGDPTLHCGGMGKMMEASGNVADNSPLVMKGAFSGAPPLPPLPLDQVRVFPDQEPFCIDPNNRGGMVQAPGLPTSGGPQVYDEKAAAAARYANQPRLEPGPTPAEAAAGQRKLAANYWLAGNDDGYARATAEADRIEGQSRYDAAKKGLEAVIKAAGADANARKEAREKLDKLGRDFRASQRNGQIEARAEPEMRDPNLEVLP